MADDVAIGLAFSGGGTRAAAFAFGVLRGLDRLPGAGGGSSLDRVQFVSGVSGGSVTAAYFGLRGRAALSDFEERFLARNAEEELRTNVSLGTILQGVNGGLNEAARLTGWLDKNLFGNATMAELIRRPRPVIWINASDLRHRTPFVFSPALFNELCSDFRKFPVSQAVAASAAVPVVFTPIVLESFRDRCGGRSPAWANRILSDRNAGAQAKAFARALLAYRDEKEGQYVKLADGGLTDNYGLSGLVISRGATSSPYAPLTAQEAVRLRRVIFVVVNAGRETEVGWSRTIAGPSGTDLLNAITDTAIDSSVRSGFDAFRLTLHEWEKMTQGWRCGLTQAQVRDYGGGDKWRCNDINFEITEISFDRSRLAEKLSSIPTRFQLPPESVALLTQAAEDIVLSDPVLNERKREAQR